MNKNNNIKCPLCEEKILYRKVKDTHTWICSNCPFISFEYYSKKNINQLKNFLNLKSINKNGL